MSEALLYVLTSSYDAAQTRRALAIITYTLRSAIPARESPSNFSHQDTLADRINMLSVAFTAYVNIVESIEPTQRADLLAVAVHLFNDLLADETPNMDYAGSMLPILKLIVSQILGPTAQVPGMGIAEGDKVIHGLLSTCLQHVDDMR